MILPIKKYITIKETKLHIIIKKRCFRGPFIKKNITGIMIS